MATPNTSAAKQEMKSAMNGAQKRVEDAYDSAEDKLSAVAQNLSDISEKVKKASSDLADRSVEIAQKYPLHTALGAVAVGFVVGALVARRK